MNIFNGRRIPSISILKIKMIENPKRNDIYKNSSVKSKPGAFLNLSYSIILRLTFLAGADLISIFSGNA
jgi:hypothetical protein